MDNNIKPTSKNVTSKHKKSNSNFELYVVKEVQTKENFKKPALTARKAKDQPIVSRESSTVKTLKKLQTQKKRLIDI